MQAFRLYQLFTFISYRGLSCFFTISSFHVVFFFLCLFYFVTVTVVAAARNKVTLKNRTSPELSLCPIPVSTPSLCTYHTSTHIYIADHSLVTVKRYVELNYSSPNANRLKQKKLSMVKITLRKEKKKEESHRIIFQNKERAIFLSQWIDNEG